MQPIKWKSPAEIERIQQQRQTKEAANQIADERHGLTSTALPQAMKRTARKYEALTHWEHYSGTGLWIIATADTVTFGINEQVCSTITK